jgi:hypothetical protein
MEASIVTIDPLLSGHLGHKGSVRARYAGHCRLRFSFFSGQCVRDWRHQLMRSHALSSTDEGTGL